MEQTVADLYSPSEISNIVECSQSGQTFRTAMVCNFQQLSGKLSFRNDYVVSLQSTEQCAESNRFKYEFQKIRDILSEKTFMTKVQMNVTKTIQRFFFPSLYRGYSKCLILIDLLYFLSFYTNWSPFSVSKSYKAFPKSSHSSTSLRGLTDCVSCLIHHFSYK